MLKIKINIITYPPNFIFPRLNSGIVSPLYFALQNIAKIIIPSDDINKDPVNDIRLIKLISFNNVKPKNGIIDKIMEVVFLIPKSELYVLIKYLDK